MHSKSGFVALLFTTLVFAAGCDSSSKPCEVADACASRCAEECGDAEVISIACSGIACNCRCGEPGAGGTGGEGGTSGGGGSGGEGGTSGGGGSRGEGG